MYEDILRYFPENIYIVIKENILLETNLLEEIRFRNNRPIILKFTNKEKILDVIVNTQDILEIMQRICDNSIYSYQSQICEGYITVKGGHRIGITGTAVVEKEKLMNLHYISGLNFRIAKQILGVSKNIIKYVLDLENNTIYNTLIVSPPGAGKTTILRDLVKNISDGIKEMNFNGKSISIIDERGEIAAMYKGIPQNEVGIRTDVIDNCFKSTGMKMMIRAMSPDIIVADEIGKIEDIDAIEYAVCCGVKGIFTAHGSKIEDLLINPMINDLLNKKIIERIIFLNKNNKGHFKRIYGLNNKEYRLLAQS